MTNVRPLDTRWFGATAFAMICMAQVWVIRGFRWPPLLRGWSRQGTLPYATAASARKTPEGVPLPEVVHRSLSQSQVKERVVIIGDVHGCYEELQELLHKCEYNEKNTTVIFVGDLTNKGPKSVDVVRLARRSGFLAVRGNHDDLALAVRFGVRDGTKCDWVGGLDDADVAWLAQLPFTLSLPHLGAVIVHGGLVPGVPIERQRLGDLYRMRNVVRTGSSASASAAAAMRGGGGGAAGGVDAGGGGGGGSSCASSGSGAAVTGSDGSDRSSSGGGGYEAREKTSEGEAWAKVWWGPEHVYFGHDARRGLQRERLATGLDTGCLYGRELTACVLPGGELVTVPARRQYSPTGEEKWRAKQEKKAAKATTVTRAAEQQQE